MMNHWAYIWSAYGLTLTATMALLIASLRSMFAAERDVQNASDTN
jgi:heme exporter protein CcmD